MLIEIGPNLVALGMGLGMLLLTGFVASLAMSADQREQKRQP